VQRPCRFSQSVWQKNPAAVVNDITRDFTLAYRKAAIEALSTQIALP